MKINTLRFKLTLWYLIILGLLVSASGVFLFQVMKEKRMAEFDRDLRDQAGRMSERWERTEGLTWEQAIAQTQEGARRPYIRLEKYYFRDSRRTKDQAQSLRSASVPEQAFPFEKEAYEKGLRRLGGLPVFLTIRDPLLEAAPVRVIIMPASHEDVLQFGVSLNEWLDNLRGLGLLMLLAGGLLLGLAFAGGSFIIRKALGPVQDIVRTARKITTDDLSLRLPGRRRKDEIGELVDTFNEMIARLETSVANILQFSGDVSHELRTPLTAIRSEIEVLLRKERSPQEYADALRSALEETGRLEKIVNDLLFLSRLDTVEGGSFEADIRLEDVVAAVFGRAAAAARDKGLHPSLSVVESAPARGNADILERLAANLMENAVRYTPPGGRIEVTVDRDDSGAGRIVVADTGIGIPREAIPGIYDRFTVVDASRSKETGGAGLGLSIVKRVADLHGAAITVESRVGEGTRFTVLFPATSSIKGSGRLPG
jgi:heavy metal sensor kinase